MQQNNLGMWCSCSGSMGKPYVQPSLMSVGSMLQVFFTLSDVSGICVYTQQVTLTLGNRKQGIAAGYLMLRYIVQPTFVYCLNLTCLTLTDIIIATKSRCYDEVEILKKCRKGLECISSMINQVVWIWFGFFFYIKYPVLPESVPYYFFSTGIT